MQTHDNYKLKNLSAMRRVLLSVALAVSSALYVGSWFAALILFLWIGQEVERLSVGSSLAALYMHDKGYFATLFLSHALALTALLASANTAFRRVSLRRRLKALLAATALALAVLDLACWTGSPFLPLARDLAGAVAVASATILSVMALLPLKEMWGRLGWQDPPLNPLKCVVIGGGFGGLYTALGLDKRLGYHPKLSLTLVDQNNYFLFPPLLPSAAAGTIETRQVTYPFRRILENTNIRFKMAKVLSIDPQRRKIRVCLDAPATGGPAAPAAEVELAYDLLVLAPGGVNQTFNTKGVAEHALFMRGLGDAINVRNQVIDCFERAAALMVAAHEHDVGLGQLRELLRFVVVGGGPTGVELATEVKELIDSVLLKRYPEIVADHVRVTLVQSDPQVLTGWDASIIKTTSRQIAKLGIELCLDARVAEVGATFVKLGDGTLLTTRTCVWCAGVKPSPLLLAAGLKLDRAGRAEVDADLRASGFPNIFVVGDSAACVDVKSGKTLPPIGQVAFQQGSHTAANIARALRGRPMRPFRYFDFGQLVSAGEHFAAVKLLGVKLSGTFAWLVWRTLYLSKLVGVSNKLRVVVDWGLDLMIERSISQIKVAPAVRQAEQTKREAA